MTFYRRYRPLFNLIGLLLLVALIIFFKIDLRQTLAYLAHAHVLDLALAVIFLYTVSRSQSMALASHLARSQHALSFSEALKLYALGLGAGMVTPGQVGDAVKVAYFPRTRLAAARYYPVLLDRFVGCADFAVTCGEWHVFILARISRRMARTCARAGWHRRASHHHGQPARATVAVYALAARTRRRD